MSCPLSWNHMTKPPPPCGNDGMDMDMDLQDLEPRNERERFIWEDGHRHAEAELRPEIEVREATINNYERYTALLIKVIQFWDPDFEG